MEESRRGLHYGCIIVAACCAILFMAVPFGLNTMGVFFTAVSAAMELSPGTVSLVITGVAAGMTIGVPIMGRLFDKVSVRWLVAGSGILEALGAFVLSISTSLVPYVCGGFVMGWGLATLLHLMTSGLINRWFANRAGTYIGIAMAFTGIGGVVWSPVLGMVINSMGWQMAYRVEAIVLLVVILPLALFVLRDRPEDKGLLPVGYEESQTDAASAAPEAADITAGRAMKSGAFFLLLIVAFIAGYGMYGHTMTASYVNSLPVAAGAGLLGATISSVALAGQTIGKISLGAVADKSSVVTALIGFGFGIIGIVGYLMFPDSVVLLGVSGFCLGVFTTLTNVLMPVMTRAMFGTKDFVKIWSVVAMVGQAGSLVQAPTLGTLITVTGGFSAMYLVLAATFAIGIIVSPIAMKLAKHMQEEN